VTGSAGLPLIPIDHCDLIHQLTTASFEEYITDRQFVARCEDHDSKADQKAEYRMAQSLLQGFPEAAPSKPTGELVFADVSDDQMKQIQKCQIYSILQHSQHSAGSSQLHPDKSR
jgi:hypothetical protein